MTCYRVWAIGLLLFGRGVWADSAAPAGPDFNREVRPILSHNCFKCHGPDDQARKAGFRLDLPGAASKPAKSGDIPIVPGKPDQSELVARIFASDPDDIMPPNNTKLVLSEQQKQILKRWIAAGAQYQPHWAFVKPKQAPLPQVHHSDWPRNPIDYFVLQRLESEGLDPSPPADPYTLVRRVYLDLVGWPPTPEEADAFVSDHSPQAYERLVDRLLASPHYGERWARKWLDLARYADTNGYEKDRPRSIWPWRDWVIRAINADLPFDRFTIDQVAGDLLPHPTQDDIIATGFHRNTMLNEEGGIDPLEFRFYSTVDRMATTGKTWLGLTLQCAQCHTHKYDPVPHREYYQMSAFLDNADELTCEVKPPDFEKVRADIDSKIARISADLTNRFPLDEIRWASPDDVSITTQSGQKPISKADGSWLFTERSADRDSYLVTAVTHSTNVEFIRLEVLSDEQLPKHSSGRSDSGDFVLSEFTVRAAVLGHDEEPQPVKIRQATADFSAERFDIAGAVDGDSKTGWSVAGSGKKTEVHTAVFTLADPLAGQKGVRLLMQLDQSQGDRKTIGHFRLSVGQRIVDERPLQVRRQEAIEQHYAAWRAHEARLASHWQVLRPTEAKANVPYLTIEPDNSVLATGDQTKSDTYRLRFHTNLRNLTAIRLEALPDDRFPRHGPGRAYYEGPPGDFNLSDFRLWVGTNRLHFAKASHSYAATGFSASAAIDDNMQTGWAIDGGQGREHSAVFNLAQPLADARDFTIELHFERHFCADLGRFRISVTTDSGAALAHEYPPAIENLLLAPDPKLTDSQRKELFDYYLSLAPELVGARDEIESLRRKLTSFPTTLVMSERPQENPRPTYIHKRGEFLQPTERVYPAVLSVLNPLPAGAPRNRLGFADWLVSTDNPLTARVVVNRQWAAFFGRAIVRTVDDFGYQGDPPSHPALLDWLAVEFMKEGWSLKQLRKLIVMSATYQQSSRLTPELLAKDPSNILLARGPRVRLEAETIRDSLLRVSGLLATNIGGPSVFPPQPASVTTDGAYGPLAWKVSEGPDRYRRGLYTFSKRTAPYAMFSTFDAPSGEACLAQRETSDTPLQALTMLNDTVVLDAAQALGREFAKDTAPVAQRVTTLFRQCLTRPPDPSETELLLKFLEEQHQRIAAGELDARTIAGTSSADAKECAAWTTLARAVLNLDEMITKQ